MRTRMLSFRVANSKHFFEIIDTEEIVFISDSYEELEECIHVGTYMLEHMHETNPLREEGIPLTTSPRIHYSPFKVEKA